jgi:hypothetical protein
MARRQEGYIGKCTGGGEFYGRRETGWRWIQQTSCCDLNEVIIFFLFFTFSQARKSKYENPINWYGSVKGRNVCYRTAS